MSPHDPEPDRVPDREPRSAAEPAEPEYVLGTHDAELARLELQQEVWGPVTDALLDRAGVGPGQRVLDAGCGPGLVTAVLRERVGDAGAVVAVDESPRWGRHLTARERDAGRTGVTFRQGDLTTVELEEGAYDAIVCRWVLSFLPEAEAVVARLARALRPGGRLLVQDYNHEGLSLFPRSAGFDAMARATRALYALHGGDLFVAARLPGALRRAGLELEHWGANVLSGGPDSPAFRWADAFFPHFSGVFLERELVTPEERAGFLRDWSDRRADPDSLFFSPIVVDAIGRRAPAPGA